MLFHSLAPNVATTKWGSFLNEILFFCVLHRYYTLRERPSAGSRSGNIMEDLPMNESGEGALLGLPESQTELDVRRLCILLHFF